MIVKRIRDGIHDKDSENGRRKSELLIGPGVITPFFEGRPEGLSHRISWEFLIENVAMQKRRLVADMASAQIGAHNADALRNLQSTSSQEGVFQVVVPHLIKSYIDFDLLSGFDIDLFLKATNTSQGRAMVVMEVFPREQRGKLSPGYCTSCFFVPLEVGTPGEGKTLLETMIFAEGIRRGENPETIHERWCTQETPWQLKDRETIDLLISCCCMSLLISWGYPMDAIVVPEIGRSPSDGHVVTASLKVVPMN